MIGKLIINYFNFWITIVFLLSAQFFTWPIRGILLFYNRNGETDYTGKTLKNAAKFQALGQVASSGFAVIFALLLVRCMSIEGYASYTSFTAIGVLTCFVTAIGMDRVLGRFLPPIVLEHGNRVAVIVAFKLLAIRVVVYVIVTASLGTLAVEVFTYKGEKFQTFSPELYCYTYGVLFSINEHLRLTLSALFKSKWAATASLFQWIARILPLGFVVFVYGEVGLLFAVLITILGEAVALTVHGYMLLRIVIKFNDYKVKNTVSEEGLGSYLRFGLVNYLSALVSVPISGGYLRSYVVSNESTLLGAVFGFFYTLYDRFRPYLPVQMFENIIEAAMSVAHAEGKPSEEVFSLVGMILRFNIILVVPASAWVAFFGSGIIGVVSAGKYGGQEWVLALLMLSSLPSALMTLLMFVANIYRLSQFVLYISIVALLSSGFVFLRSEISGLNAALIVVVLYPTVFCILMTYVLTVKKHQIKAIFINAPEWVFFSIGVYVFAWLISVNFGRGLWQQGLGFVAMASLCLLWMRSRLSFRSEEKNRLVALFSGRPKIFRVVSILIG